MTELSEQLRGFAIEAEEAVDSGPETRAMFRAADEIERLTEVERDARHQRSAYVDSIKLKNAEVAEIRAALRNLACAVDEITSEGARASEVGIPALLVAARAALAGATVQPDAPREPIVACPRCGAKTEIEALTMCKPQGDECPMTTTEDWNEAMALLNRPADPASEGQK